MTCLCIINHHNICINGRKTLSPISFPAPSSSRAKLQFNAKINCSVGAGQLKSLQSQLESVLEAQLELELELESELELTNRQQAAPMIIGHLLAPFSALKGKTYPEVSASCAIVSAKSICSSEYLMHIEIIDSRWPSRRFQCSCDCSNICICILYLYLYLQLYLYLHLHS